MQRMIAAGCNNGSHDIEMITWKKMTMLALMGGLVEFVSSDQHFTICAKEAVTSRAKAKPIRDGMWTHRTLSLLSLVSRDVFLTKCHWMWRISPLALWKFEVGCIKNLSWPVVWYMTWAVRVGPFYGIIVAQNRDPYLFWYAHRSWTEFSMFRGDADIAIDLSRNAIHAPRLSRAQARVNLLPSKSCGLRPTGFDNGSQEERKRWPRLSLVTHEPRQVRKRVKNQKPKLISPFLSPNLELFSGVRNRFLVKFGIWRHLY